jgi:hypothetical protein
LFLARQFSAAVTALLLVAGAFFILVFSVSDLQAKDPGSSCAGAGHLIDDGIEPFDQEQFDVGGLACYLDPSRGGDPRIGDNARERSAACSKATSILGL